MAATDRSFLGAGWGFPPTFTRQSLGVAMVRDEQDIRESLWILFSTTPGERVMVPQYGCALQELLFQGLTRSLLTRAEKMVRQAIATWEPRVDVHEIRVRESTDVAGLVTITVDYSVRLTNTRSNIVYPFYTREATLQGQGP